jgi:tetratricopeptide (TPR) repeat protein
VQVTANGTGRRRWLLKVGATVAAVAASGAGILLWRGRPATRTAPGSTVPEANDIFARANYVLETQADPTRAREIVERALELDPAFAAARVLYGFTYLLEVDMGRSNDTTLLYRAEEELTRGLRDDPGSAKGHAALAFVYYYQGKKTLIPAEVGRALAISPDEKDALVMMALYHQLNGEYDRSQAFLLQVLNADSTFPPARANFAENLRQMGDVQGSIREYAKLLEQSPDNPLGANAAMAHLNAGDLTRARQILEQALGRQPRNFYNRLLWALLLAVEGRQDEALRAMDADVLKYAELVLFASFAAEFYAVLGDKDKALDWLDRDVRLGDERAEWFARDPLLASLTGEQRFQRILESIRARQRPRPPL